jgi:hypothetical protein
MYAPLLAVALTLAGFVSHGSPPANATVATPAGVGATCRASDVRRTVVRFVAAGNSRERQALDALIAREGLFQWFTIDDRDRRRSVGFYKRGPLLVISPGAVAARPSGCSRSRSTVVAPSTDTSSIAWR